MTICIDSEVNDKLFFFSYLLNNYPISQHSNGFQSDIISCRYEVRVKMLFGGHVYHHQSSSHHQLSYEHALPPQSHTNIDLRYKHSTFVTVSDLHYNLIKPIL